MVTSNSLPQPDTIFHGQYILRFKNPLVRAILRTTPNQFVHSSQKLHRILDFAQRTGSVDCGPSGLVIFRWKFQPQRVRNFLYVKPDR